ncbi:hypothetical protein BJY00DRAFT_208918 [Aspergillus carlsbadensis]|nr:hypothetical protein BJY00DRAFT_208918 [Aspergillus carlsbadensis]
MRYSQCGRSCDPASGQILSGKDGQPYLPNLHSSIDRIIQISLQGDTESNKTLEGHKDAVANACDEIADLLRDFRAEQKRSARGRHRGQRQKRYHTQDMEGQDSGHGTSGTDVHSKNSEDHETSSELPMSGFIKAEDSLTHGNSSYGKSDPHQEHLHTTGLFSCRISTL